MWRLRPASSVPSSRLNMRSISSTLKDIRDLQSGEDEDGQKLTVVLEGGLEDFAK